MKRVITSHISDTHNDYSMAIGEGNILFHHGDATWRSRSTEMENLNIFFTEALKKFDYVVFTPGNHDLLFESNLRKAKSYIDLHRGRVKILINQSVNLCGLKIYASPYSLQFGSWAFMKPQSTIFEEWEKIPEDIDILITHGPPYGILDFIPGVGSVGDQSLRYKVEGMKNLKLHAFGHIHESNGVVEKNGIVYLNAAVAGAHNVLPSNAYIIDWEGNVIKEINKLEGF